MSDLSYDRKKINSNSLNEILQDSFYFSILLHLKKQISNIEGKNYFVMFIKGLACVFMYELSVFFKEYNILDTKNFYTYFDKKTVMEERQWIKQCIVNSELMYKKIKDMGLDFNVFAYDMNVIKNKNKLLDTNFENFNENEDLNFWESIFSITQTISNEIFKLLTNNTILLGDVLNVVDDKIKDFENKNKDFLEIERYSYSVYKLFSKSYGLNEKDKIFILYRYRMVTSILVISKLLEKYNLSIKCNNVIDFDLKKYFRKVKSLIIVIIGNDLQKMNTEFSKFLLKEIEDIILEKDFFKINRKIRNNIHYSNIDILNEKETKLLDKYQNLYLETIAGYIENQMYVNVDENDIEVTSFLKRCSELNLSNEEIEKEYFNHFKN